ncbi:MAG: chorismate synthase, partial [Eggerthellaceae bacterium]|nr:chorismate synthase [Eggerthellaceae bacterium]
MLVGFRVDMSDLYNDFDKARESFESQFSIMGTITYISGITDGYITSSTVVLQIDFNGSTLLLPNDCIGRVGTADIPVALRDDCLSCENTAFYSTRYELCARAVATSISRTMLAECGIDIYSYVTSIGSKHMHEHDSYMDALAYTPLDIETSYVRCPSSTTTQEITAEIFAAKSKQATLPGQFRVVAFGLVPGLGNETSGIYGLNAQIAAATMSIDGILSCSFGPYIHASMTQDVTTYGNNVIELDVHGFNFAHSYLGGLASGVTDGMPLVVSAMVQAPWGARNLPDYFDDERMKALHNEPPHSINISTLEEVESPY